MKNDEIRALVDEAKADIAFCEEHIKSLPMYDFKMTMRLTAAIETLLAREAEVLAVCNEYDMDLTDSIIAILYPQPFAPIREIADRLGFAPMPAELGQRNLDGETNYVQPTETTDDE